MATYMIINGIISIEKRSEPMLVGFEKMSRLLRIVCRIGIGATWKVTVKVLTR